MADGSNTVDTNPADILCQTEKMTWIPFTDAISYKVLRTSSETGTWTVLFKCDKGSSFGPHYHYGAGEYLMLKGVMDYRAGIARAGDYGYEPLGVFHEHTAFVEDTVLWFANHGPVAFLNPDKSIALMLDWKFFADAQEKQAQAA